MFARLPPAPPCLDCASEQTKRLEHQDALQSLSVFYYRCSDCGFVWVIDHETGETTAVTVKPGSQENG
jgi:uncharacterized Zn finger protein